MSDLIEVVVGRIGQAHGIRGDVAIELRTDEPGRRFVPGARMRLASGRQLELATTSWRRGRLHVSFAGVLDRTSVEALRGELLTVEVPSDEEPSEPGEYFDRQLVGLMVRDHRGARVGTVTGVLHLPAQDVLQVMTKAGEERMVPFVSALVPTVDIGAGHLQLADVGGLLEDVE